MRSRNQRVQMVVWIAQGPIAWELSWSGLINGLLEIDLVHDGLLEVDPKQDSLLQVGADQVGLL